MRWDLNSGVNFLERLGLVQSGRQPWPPIDTRALTANTLSLDEWTPIPEQLEQFDGDPPPDRGQTYEWPPEL